MNTYKEVMTVELPGSKARVYISELTAAERSRRMKVIHNQAAKLLKRVQ